MTTALSAAPVDESRDSSVGIASLPAKLVTRILCYLDALEIIGCQLVSRQLRDIIHNSPSLQCLIEYDLSGVVDGSANRSSPAEQRLEAIKAWRAAWRNPPWKTEPTATIQVYQSPEGASTLISTIYADTNPEDNDGFAFLRLSSPHRGLTEQRWAIEALPDWSEQYTFDDAQDLLVLPHHIEGTRELNMHILTCTTGKPHPATKVSTIRLTADEPIALREDAWDFNVNISGDLLGLHISRDPSGDNVCEFWVVNWKTGKTLLNIYNDTEAQFQLHSFTFLDAARVLLLVRESYTTPDIIVLDCTQDIYHGRTRVEDILDGAALVLGLPDLGEDDSTDTITLECRPLPPHAAAGERIRQSDALPVVLVAYRSHWDYDPERTFDLLVPARAIAARIASDDTAPQPRCLLWAQWCAECRQVNGPERGTLFPNTRVCGSRYITTAEGPAGEREVCIYDFDSVPALRRDVARGESAVVLAPTVVRSPYVQGERRTVLRTEAPFREIRTGVVLDDEAEVFIGEDGFVIRRRGEKEDYMSLEVYTI